MKDVLGIDFLHYIEVSFPQETGYACTVLDEHDLTKMYVLIVEGEN